MPDYGILKLLSLICGLFAVMGFIVGFAAGMMLQYQSDADFLSNNANNSPIGFYGEYYTVQKYEIPQKINIGEYNITIMEK